MPADLRFFDPAGEVAVVSRRLPHWLQTDCVYFLTWRTYDSIPKAWLGQWQADRQTWLLRHGVDPRNGGWRAGFDRLPPGVRRQYHRAFAARWEEYLDRAEGECALRRPEIRAVVADSLRHFDGDRYRLTDFVVMPNHVHVLAAFPGRTPSWPSASRGSTSRRHGSTGYSVGRGGSGRPTGSTTWSAGPSILNGSERTLPTIRRGPGCGPTSSPTTPLPHALADSLRESAGHSRSE